MTVDPRIALRLQFLARVVRKECRHLATTDQRLFASAFTLAQANQLKQTRRGWLAEIPRLDTAGKNDAQETRNVTIQINI